MLTQLHLTNFKSWRDTGPMRLSPITAFLGPNSSGKTSILQSLLLLRQTTESADRNRVLDLGGPSTLVDLGTYRDIAFDHDPSSVVGFEIRWEEDEPINVRDLLKQARKQASAILSSRYLGLSVQITTDRNEVVVRRVDYALGDAHFTMEQHQPGQYELTSDDFGFVRSLGRRWKLPPPARFYGFPDQVRLYYQNAGFLSDLELAFESACQRIRYLGPLRDDPRRQYIFSGSAPSDVGRRGELAVEALIASRIAGTKSSRGWTGGQVRKRRPRIPLEQLIAEWLKELGLIHSFELETLDDRETLYRVLVRKSPNSVPVLLTDVGFGVSQVLPVLVSLAYAQEGDTVILEQPEIHLHPAVQSGLADVIIEAALARGVQVLLETHSEHLFARLQRRLAERELARGLVLEPDDVALYFCQYSGTGSTLELLDVDLFGNVRNWPPDFFGNPMRESVAMLEAQARRSE